MPRRLTSLMALIAAVALILGAFISVGRWYRELDGMEQVSVDVARTVLMIVSGIFGVLLAPFLVSDWLRDRRRELERKALAREASDVR
jgi:hypothetical protein